ncbi:MAG: ACT domain-containing protein [Deltaproteobacteria bacterium]|nr:ACT domain-containing protein [Deltaproteobacteria bacterium]
MEPSKLVLSVLEETFSIHRLAPDASLPEAVSECDFYSLSKTTDELSLVCPEHLAVKSEKSNPDWKCLKVAGPLDFELTGILAGITEVLAKEKLSVFAISTFDTDYILIKKQGLTAAISALERVGYIFN